METHDRRPVELARLTTEEAASALARAEVVILPVGATEQHGPNLTLETDTAIAYELARRIALRLFPRALVTPPLPFGVSYHHLGFPGTLTLSPDTFVAVLLDLAKSLRHHGVRRLFILDGHAGNRGVLDVVTTKLRFELGSPQPTSSTSRSPTTSSPHMPRAHAGAMPARSKPRSRSRSFLTSSVGRRSPRGSCAFLAFPSPTPGSRSR